MDATKTTNHTNQEGNMTKQEPCKDLSIEEVAYMAGEIVKAHNVVGGILKSSLDVANMMYVRGTTEHAIAALAAQKVLSRFVYHLDERRGGLEGRIWWVESRRPYVSHTEGSK